MIRRRCLRCAGQFSVWKIRILEEGECLTKENARGVYATPVFMIMDWRAAVLHASAKTGLIRDVPIARAGIAISSAVAAIM